MRKLITFIFLSQFLVHSCHAQTHPSLLAFNKLNLTGYSSALKSMEDYALEHQNDSDFNASTLYQTMSWYYSFVGIDSLALQYFDKALNPNASEKVAKKIHVDTSNYKVLNAQEYILTHSAKQQIVIINEAHHVPKHRILTMELLESLKDQGFTYLAIEGISHTDSLLVNRGYPERVGSGFYTSEALFGNLIRTALKNSFKIVPYNFAPRCEYDPKNPEYCKNERDLFHARQILKILETDKDAKILIHCGFDHNQEKSKTEWVKMAEHIRKLSGIDAFTINQTKFMERAYPSLEAPFYYSLSNQVESKQPYVLIQHNQEPYVPKVFEGRFDVQVFWPRLTYKYGRPKYLFEQKGIHNYFIDPKEIKLNTLVQAYYKNESENAVPIDQFFVGDTGIEYCLALPSGDFTIRIRNEYDEIIRVYDIAIK